MFNCVHITLVIMLWYECRYLCCVVCVCVCVKFHGLSIGDDNLHHSLQQEKQCQQPAVSLDELKSVRLRRPHERRVSGGTKMKVSAT